MARSHHIVMASQSSFQVGCWPPPLLALNDDGAPVYDKNVATHLAALDTPAFACTPDQFPDLMASAIKKEDLKEWMAREGIRAK